MEFTFKRSRKPYSATAYNISDTGLYVETDRELRPGQDVRIHMQQAAVSEAIPATPEDHVGVIRWALPRSKGRHHVYGAGISLFHPDLGFRYEGQADVQYFCDLCGEQVNYRQIRKEGYLWLCPRCSEYVRSLPVAVSQVTSRYLIGNVL